MGKKNWLLIIGLVLVLAIMGLAGCVSEKPPVSHGGLEDIRWVLESHGGPENLQTVLEGTEITAIFDSAEGQVTGSAGCNSYWADYEANGNKLPFTSLFWTEIGCVSPEGVMEQEQEFLSLLANVQSFQADDTTLTIICSDGRQLYFTTATR